MAFDIPQFTVWKIVYTAIGAAVFWGIQGRTKLKPFVIAPLVSRLPLSKHAKEVIEFIIFIALGCIIGIGFADPNNPRQALTAGFGWTGAFARAKKNI